MFIYVCDDDKENNRQCRERLETMAVSHNITVEIQSVYSGEQLLFEAEDCQQQIDAVYMDIHMRKLDGVLTAEKLRELGVNADIIFYTHDGERWEEAFDVEAYNYILKDQEDKARFERIFLKAAERASKRNVEVLLLSCAGEHRRVPVREIMYFEVDRRIVTVHYGANKTFEFYSPLSKLEEALFGKGFIRIHPTCLVAEKYIVSIGKADVTLANKVSLPISRAARAKLLEERAG